VITSYSSSPLFQTISLGFVWRGSVLPAGVLQEAHVNVEKGEWWRGAFVFLAADQTCAATLEDGSSPWSRTRVINSE
jgi:hypothetical protein